MENHSRRTKMAASRAFPAATSTYSVQSTAAQKNGPMARAAWLRASKMVKHIETMSSKMVARDGQ
jgi:hypothetical protein